MQKKLVPGKMTENTRSSGWVSTRIQSRMPGQCLEAVHHISGKDCKRPMQTGSPIKWGRTWAVKEAGKKESTGQCSALKRVAHEKSSKSYSAMEKELARREERKQETGDFNKTRMLNEQI